MPPELIDALVSRVLLQASGACGSRNLTPVARAGPVGPDARADAGCARWAPAGLCRGILLPERRAPLLVQQPLFHGVRSHNRAPHMSAQARTSKPRAAHERGNASACRPPVACARVPVPPRCLHPRPRPRPPAKGPRALAAVPELDALSELSSMQDSNLTDRSSTCTCLASARGQPRPRVHKRG